MKLRARFARHQLLFLLIWAALAAGAENFITLNVPIGQLPARADTLILTDNSRKEGRILGVQGNNVQLQTQAGTIGWPLANVKEIQMPAPPEVAQAQQAFAAKDYAKALGLLRAVEKFKGLPVEWAQVVTGMVGDLYVAMNDPAKAEAAYREYQRIYPKSGSLQTDVGMARIAASKKDYATAKQKLEPVAAAALKEKNVPHANAVAYSQTFYILGQVKESEGNEAGALEDYLRTITLFFHDPTAVAAAQERADIIRKEQKIHVP